MRFESLLWSILATFLAVGATWGQMPVDPATPAAPVYEAADGPSDIPPKP